MSNKNNKLPQDCYYFNYDLKVFSLILDREEIEELPDDEYRKFCEDIGHCILAIDKYYVDKFTGIDEDKIDYSKLYITTRKGKRFFKELLQSVNKAVRAYEKSIEDGKKGAQKRWRKY